MSTAVMTAAMISAIHHVAIICSDYPRSKHFYTQILGFEIIDETYRAERDSYKLDLRVGKTDQIELFSFPNRPERPSYPEALGLRHLAFAVSDLTAQIATLADNGIETEPIRTDELTGKQFTFFQDPDGLPLELYESATGSEAQSEKPSEMPSEIETDNRVVTSSPQ